MSELDEIRAHRETAASSLNNALQAAVGFFGSTFSSTDEAHTAAIQTIAAMRSRIVEAKEALKLK